MKSNFALDCPDLLRRAQPPRKATRLILLLITLVWAALVVTGLYWLWSYENAPGLSALPPSQWPTNSRIQLANTVPTLVMLAHPRCPCSRASVGELAKIMAHGQRKMRAYVLFTTPAGSADNWEKGDLWQSASEIPGVTVVKDGEGIEARLFNAATSGQTALYNNQGQLLFSGGITAARGHFGDNAGQASIIAIVNAESPGETETSVFGCPLFDPESECKESKQ